MASQWQHNRQFWFGMIISVICVAAILFFINPRDIWQALRSTRLDYVGLMALGLVLFLALRAVRWRFMLGTGVQYGPVFHVQNIGYMLNMTLPLRIGDVARAVLIGNIPPATTASGISTMVVERILDMLFIVALLPFTLTAVDRLPSWMQDGAQGFGIVSLVGIVLVIIAANQRPFALRMATAVLDRLPFLDTATWVQRLDDLLGGLSSLTRLKDGLILLVLSVLIWVPIIVIYGIGMQAVGIQLTPLQVCFVVCAAALSVALPSSPGQIGVFHAAVITSLVFLGQDETLATSMAIIYHALNVMTMVIMGLIGLVATGATLGQVVQTAQRFVQRNRPKENES